MDIWDDGKYEFHCAESEDGDSIRYESVTRCVYFILHPPSHTCLPLSFCLHVEDIPRAELSVVGHNYELFRIGDEYQFKCDMTTSDLVVWRECPENDDNNSCSENTYQKVGTRKVGVVSLQLRFSREFYDQLSTSKSLCKTSTLRWATSSSQASS